MNSPTTATPSPAVDSPGTLIGPYKFLELIGEGGLGSVWMAEQRTLIARRIALKIIKPGVDSRMVLARFEAERQALALMDHLNIARVLDAGMTESGKPYFVIEHVKGDPITAFAAAHRLSIKDRLALFAQVCHAVQRAHTKSVIHRDLKPANIITIMSDGRLLAKVIDFGIAKSLSSRLTEKTLFTEHRQLIGTPEYMSPEQAEGSINIDTRTDVYALGMLLYELLTGDTPFDAKRLRSAALAEMQRIIRDEEPPTPSVRIECRLLTPVYSLPTQPSRTGFQPVSSTSTSSVPSSSPLPHQEGVSEVPPYQAPRATVRRRRAAVRGGRGGGRQAGHRRVPPPQAHQAQQRPGHGRLDMVRVVRDQEARPRGSERSGGQPANRSRFGEREGRGNRSPREGRC